MASKATGAAATNVVGLPKIQLPGIGIAATAAPGQRISGSRNEVWLCQAYSNGVGLLLYVKPALSTRRMMVEALAAQVAQCMRLPCPDPYIVTVKPHHVGRPKSSQNIIAFASEAAGTRALARPVLDLDVMFDLLDRLKLTEGTCVLDEWIANAVRGPRDVLFDPGSDQGAAIIDHEGAMESGVAADTAVTNWLAARVLERTDAKHRLALLKALRARATAAHKAELSLVPGTVQYVQDGMAVYTELLQFLQARLQHLDRLLSTRVLPEQRHLDESSDSAAPAVPSPNAPDGTS